MFENFQPIYPDFISKKIPIMVGDAKYIPLDNQEEYAESSERAISIYYKSITYMYRFKSDYGFLVFPHPKKPFDETYTIKETNGKLRKLGLAIPQEAETFTKFQNEMRINEQLLKLEKT